MRGGIEECIFLEVKNIFKSKSQNRLYIARRVVSCLINIIIHMGDFEKGEEYSSGYFHSRGCSCTRPSALSHYVAELPREEV